MDLTLIGPDRRRHTRLGRLSVTIADVAGIAIGALIAVAVLLLLT
jgi:hypothetical protein